MNLRFLLTLSALAAAVPFALGETAPAEKAPVTSQLVVDTIRTELVSHFNLMGDLKVEITGPWQVPQTLASSWQVEVMDFPSIATSSMAIHCHFIADGTSAGDAMIVVHSTLWRDAWFARQPIASGTTFDATCLESHRVDALKDRDALPSNVGDDAFVIAVTIPAGRGLTWHDVARRPLVRKGEMVEVTASEGGLTVNMKGVALESGARGDVVNIRNTESLKTIPAVVVADNHVQVHF
jgi:flagella basal body P-ring formation protein FlgA